MVFIANGNTANDCYFNGKFSAIDNNSWLWKYLMYTNCLQKGEQYSLNIDRISFKNGDYLFIFRQFMVAIPIL